MDLSISPDIEAFWCYLVLFILALTIAGVQVRGLLKGYENVWASAGAWLLLASYTAIPVALFWFLDRADALHDTSLFAAILVALTYRQIISGGADGFTLPAGFAKAWQPLVTWSDKIAAGISARIARNGSRYDGTVIHRIANDPKVFEAVRRLALNRAADPAKLQKAIDDFDKLKPPLDDSGVQERKANYLYYSVKALPDVDSERFFLELGLIGKQHYYLYAREWSSKLLVIGGLAIVAACVAGYWSRIPVPIFEARYYLWRFEKPNATDIDRFRASQHLEQGLRDGNPQYVDTVRRELTRRLAFDDLPVETADRILKILLNRALISNSQELIDELADALRTDNPDLRARTQKELLYIGDERRLPIPAGLRNWKPGKEDASTCVDAVANEWARLGNSKHTPDSGALLCLTRNP